MAVYRAGSAGTVLTTNTGANVTSPTTANEGDIVWALLETRAASATLTTVNGWTVFPVALTSGTAWILLRTASAGQTGWASPIVSSSSNQQCIVGGLLAGVSIPSPSDTTKVQSGSGSTSPVTVPSCSGGVAGGIVVGMVAASRGMTGMTWATFTEDVDVETGTSNTTASLSGGHLELAATGATATASVTLATAGNEGHMAVVLPPLLPPDIVLSPLVPGRY